MNIKLYNPTEPQVDFYRLIYESAPFVSLIVAGRQTG